VRIKSFVLGAALLSAAGLSAPALAYTHHPSTKAERKQTDDLNAQALAKAQGQQPMQQQAANTAMPEQQNNAMTPQPSAAPTDQQNEQNSTKPAQPSEQQKAQTPEQTPQPSPQQ